MKDMRLFVDMDGTLCEWREATDMSELYEKGYFETLKPNPGIIDIIRSACEKGIEVYILSCFLEDSEYALAEKKSWVDRYVPFIREDRRLFVPCGQDKADHIRTLTGNAALSESDVLLDDYSTNCISWEGQGGRAIKFLNGVNGKNGTFKGKRVSAHAIDLELSVAV